MPADGATYPGNGVLFFSGHLISLDFVTVTVDGQAASFMPASRVVPPGLSGIQVRIDPPPTAGQNVAIQGDFCMPIDGCAPVSIHFTAAPPDNTAPESASAMSFDIYDYLDFKSSGGDCQSDSDIGWWVTIEGTAALPDEAPVIYLVEAFRDATLMDLAFSKTTFVSASTTKLSFRNMLTILNGTAAPEALCFRISAFDAAGNAETGGTLVVCEPCHYRTDSASPDPFLPPPEPAWTAANLYPGGTCALGTSTGSGGATTGSGAGTTGSGAGTGGSGGGTGGSGANDAVPTTEGGCVCNASGPEPHNASSWAFPALVAAVASALRGRRRRVK
jgi:hypothetical protein